MKLKKTICVLAAALSIGAAGCGKAHSEYDFDGEINGDQVKFSTGYKFLIPDNNYLNVVRQDGASVQYCDERFSNLKLEKVIIDSSNTHWHVFASLGFVAGAILTIVIVETVE